jgi:small subunit ribosomal protein S1
VVVLELDKDNRRMSLGHKQLEENPWEVFETIFAVGSKHAGTVVKMDGNQAVVALPYGLEGSCHVKHLRKADESNVAVEEAADFVVLEFNRNAKRITVSHTRSFEEAPASAAAPSKERKPRSGAGNNRMMNEVNASVERSTFGDLDVLSALKEQMDGNEDAGAAEEPKEEKKPAKKAAAKKPAAKKAATKKATTKKEEAPEAPEAESAEAPAEAEAAKEPKKPTKKAATKKAAAKKAPAKKKAKKADGADASDEVAKKEK